MPVRAVRIYGDPVLRKRAAEVIAFDDSLRSLVTDLFDTMRVYRGVGIAAPQVGVAQRVFVVDVPVDEERHERFAVVNPVLDQRDGRETSEEGCLSIPGIFEDVVRADSLRIRAFDENGQPYERRVEGYLARAIQHETDHLDGVLFTDRLPMLKRGFLRRQLDALARGEVPEGYHPPEGWRELLKPRVVFMGTPEFAVPALRAVAQRCDVVRVVTQPDRPAGRGRALAESAVSRAAAGLGLPVSKPAEMKAPEVRDALAAERADVFAVVAFGAILMPGVLALPRAGCINLHGSLLPDYRGASPVHRALWDGRAETGACTIFMDDGIDTGDVILTAREPVRDQDDAATLAARLAELGAPLLAESCVLAHEGRAPRAPQDRAAGSYAKKLKKRDGAVDWALGARDVWHHARAVTPWPGATAGHAGRRLLLLASRPVAGQGLPGTVLDVGADGVTIACGDGALCVNKVKPEGRGELAAAEWARGARLAVGDRLDGGKEFVS